MWVCGQIQYVHNRMDGHWVQPNELCKLFVPAVAAMVEGIPDLHCHGNNHNHMYKITKLLKFGYVEAQKQFD